MTERAEKDHLILWHVNHWLVNLVGIIGAEGWGRVLLQNFEEWMGDDMVKIGMCRQNMTDINFFFY